MTPPNQVLAIIGTAGRGDDASRLTLPLWNDMKRLIARFVKERGFTDVISGASSFSDHLAVGLFNAKLVSKLTLAIPCTFGWESSRFVSGHEPFDPATRLNQLHSHFSSVIKRQTLEEIKVAIYNGAEAIQRRGFHERNEVVAERASHIIAFTFGDGNKIADGGTAHTCRLYLAGGKKELFHVDLNTMMLHENGTVN